MLQILFDAVALGSLFALVALGIALIFGIMGLINFAHGEIIMVAAYVMLAAHSLPLPLFIFVTVAAAALFAIATERIAFRPLRGADPVTLLVTSFAISYLVQNIALLGVSARAKAVSIPLSWLNTWDFAGARIDYLDAAVIIACLVLLGGLGALLKFTNLGIQMRAAAEDFRMARLLGVHANRVIPTAFAISGVLAGVAGFLYISKAGSFNPYVGLPLLLPAVVAAVIGGLGSLVGAIVGGYILGFATVFLQVLLPDNLVQFRDVFVFLLVIVVFQIRPEGLFTVYRERV